MADIKHVIVTTRNPRPGDKSDLGHCVEGWFTELDGLISLVEADGRPVRSNSGTRVTQRLEQGSDPRRIASRMLAAHWRAESGDDGKDFYRQLNYTEPYGGY